MTRNSHSLNLLVIEDEPVLSMDLEAILEDCGHSVVSVAGSFESALAAIETERQNIDAALVDANLSGKSSFPIVEQLRRYRIPCLIVSGYDPNELKEMGFTEPILEKPYNENKIKRALADF